MGVRPNWGRGLGAGMSTLGQLMMQDNQQKEAEARRLEQRQYDEDRYNSRVAQQNQTWMDRQDYSDPYVGLSEGAAELMPGSQGLGPSPSGRPLQPGMAPMSLAKYYEGLVPAPEETQPETYSYNIPGYGEVGGLTGPQVGGLVDRFAPEDPAAPIDTWIGPFENRHEGLSPTSLDTERYAKMGWTQLPGGGWEHKDPVTGQGTEIQYGSTPNGVPIVAHMKPKDIDEWQGRGYDVKFNQESGVYDFTERQPEQPVEAEPEPSFGTEAELNNYISTLIGSPREQKSITVYPEADTKYKLTHGWFGDPGSPQFRSGEVENRQTGGLLAGLNSPPQGMLGEMKTALIEADQSGGLMGHGLEIIKPIARKHLGSALSDMMEDGILSDGEVKELQGWKQVVNWGDIKSGLAKYNEEMDKQDKDNKAINERNIAKLMGVFNSQPQTLAPQSGDEEFMKQILDELK